MTPLWGSLVGDLPFALLWAGKRLTGAFRLVTEDPPAPDTASVPELLAFLARVLHRWAGKPLEAPRRLLGTLPTRLLRRLLAEYRALRNQPMTLLLEFMQDPDFRASTSFEWRLLKSGMVGRPEPSAYLIAFCAFHMQQDAVDAERERGIDQRVRAAFFSMGMHNPKALQDELKRYGAAQATPQAEAAESALERELTFYRTDPIFSDTYEIPDFVLAQMAAGFGGLEQHP